EDKDSPMPPKSAPQLSGAELQILSNWINTDAPETVVGTGEKPDPSLTRGPYTWEKISKKILEKKCTSCHSGDTPDAGLDVTKIEVVRERSDAVFKKVVILQDTPHPVAPLPILSPRERLALFKWMDTGMPQ